MTGGPKRYLVEVVLLDLELTKKAKDPELDRWLILDTDELDEAKELFKTISERK